MRILNNWRMIVLHLIYFHSPRIESQNVLYHLIIIQDPQSSIGLCSCREDRKVDIEKRLFEFLKGYKYCMGCYIICLYFSVLILL